MTNNGLPERYRPTSFDQLVGQDHVQDKLGSIDSLDDLQHLLLVGKPGLGKTTTAHILKEQLLDHPRQNFKELNGSNDRGIDVVKNNMKQFARTRPTGSDDRNILFIDESDSLTKEAQQALRRVIEKYDGNTVFIFSANDEDAFLDAIKSRCKILRYHPIGVDQIVQRLRQICDSEGYEYDEASLIDIGEHVNGDMRSAINELWYAVDNGVVQEPEQTSRIDITPLFDAVCSGNVIKAKAEKDTLLDRGYEPRDVIEALWQRIEDEYQKHVDEKDERIKKPILHTWHELIADTEYRMAQDVMEELQLERMITKMVMDR